MPDTIFSIGPDQRMVALNHTPCESERVLQQLLANFPSLLLGEDDEAAPTRLLLIGREVSLNGQHDSSGTWKIDHLFVDRNAVPTIVEVKHSKNAQLRREVVGQLLDYAANAVVYWPIPTLRSTFEQTCASTLSKTADEVLSEFIGPDAEPDQFWTNLKTNLQAGKLRLIFAADAIPSELRRVIEFLNQQMDPVEVLGMELKQFAKGEMQIFVPHLIGATTQAEGKKGRGNPAAKYDADYYLANGYDAQAVNAFTGYVHAIEQMSAARGWNLTPKYNKDYVAMRMGGNVRFGIWWYGTKKRLVIYFRLSQQVAEKFATESELPLEKYHAQWSQAAFKLWPENIDLERYVPLMEASLQVIAHHNT